MNKKISLLFTGLVAVNFAFAQTKKLPPPPPAPPPPPIEAAIPPPPPPAVEIAVVQPPPPPPAPPPPPKVQLPHDLKAFLKRNQNVAAINWQQAHKLIVKLHSGKKEVYDLNNGEERKAAESKYGKLPAAPPPPPPVPVVKEEQQD